MSCLVANETIDEFMTHPMSLSLKNKQLCFQRPIKIGFRELGGFKNDSVNYEHSLSPTFSWDLSIGLEGFIFKSDKPHGLEAVT